MDQAIATDTTHALSRSRRRWVLFACSAFMFMTAVESTIVSTAIPTIVAALGSFELFSWVFAVYLLSQAVSTPIYGRLADLYGRKWVLAAGSGLFLLGTTLCSLAPSMLALIAFRLVQGLGAGAVTPVAYTLISDIYSGAERARVQGYLNIIWGGAAVIGPLLGGFLTAQLGWPSIFWINLPVGAFAISTLLLVYHEAPHPAVRGVDYLGAILLAIGVGALMLALVQWAQLPGTLIAGLLASAATALTLLIVHERRIAVPMVDLTLWRNRVVAASNIAAVAIGAVMMATNVFVPIYVQGLMGRTPIVAGFALTTQSITWTFTGALAGWAASRRSYREISAWGGACLLAGALFFVTLAPERGPLWAATGAGLIGFGMGFCNTIFLIAAQESVDRLQRGSATSGVVFMRMVGQSLGTAMLAGALNLGLAGRTGAGTAIDGLMEPSLRGSLPAAEIARLIDTLARAIGNVFFITLAWAILALLLAFGLPAGRRSSPRR